jgi:hypothetical protein
MVTPIASFIDDAAAYVRALADEVDGPTPMICLNYPSQRAMRETLERIIFACEPHERPAVEDKGSTIEMMARGVRIVMYSYRRTL